MSLQASRGGTFEEAQPSKVLQDPAPKLVRERAACPRSLRTPSLAFPPMVAHDDSLDAPSFPFLVSWKS